MHLRAAPIPPSLLATLIGLAALGCGSRSGLLPGDEEPSMGGSPNTMPTGSAGMPTAPECRTAADCPQPPPNQCGTASCNAGRCALDPGPICDDNNPCTVDACVTGTCAFMDGRVDADGDGAFASGTRDDPKAALGCGQDCNDSDPKIHPGAVELCDATDNDCNGVVDDGALLGAPKGPPTRVSPASAMHAEAAGLAFDGTNYGASITTWTDRSFGQFQRLNANGKLLGKPEQVAHVNAESYGGPLAWSGERYLTAYQDARQGGSYEIYFDLLNPQGQRLIEDLRVTRADKFSLRPSVLWTGAETLLIWDDRRFEAAGDASAIFGQRVSIDGKLVGENLRLSPQGVRAENATAALSDTGVGVAFEMMDAAGRPVLGFLTTSRALGQPSAVTTIDFQDANSPVVTAVGEDYVVTFHQHGDTVIGPSIFGVVIGKSGIRRGPQSLTAGAAHARGNATYSYGDRFVMVWADDRSGIYQLYAQVFDANLAPLGEPLAVTSTGTLVQGPVVAPGPNGALGVLYTDQGKGAYQPFFTQLQCVQGPSHSGPAK